MPMALKQNIGIRGNIMLFLLIAIAVMGGLAAVFMRTSGGTDDTGKNEQGSINASRIINKAASIRTAVNSLLLRGCSENTISLWTDKNGDGLESALDENYNPLSPADKSCHVFREEGAGLRSDGIINSFNHGSFVDVGTAANDLYFLELYETASSARGISRETCMAMNRDLKNGFDIDNLPRVNISTSAFTNTFGTTPVFGDNGAEIPMAGKKAGCLIDTDCGGTTCNVFYAVILER